ncbi:MAG: hypothetical protein H0W82_02665 [Actinobacteria bacterium]|nr:hypothetical protein [Actinomycetota bacterium]
MRRNGRVPRASIVAALATAIMIMSAVPAAALSTSADVGPWMANGRVYTSVRVGNTLYIGGMFTKVEERASGGDSYAANNLAAIDVTTGAGIPSFTPDVTDSVDTATVRSLAVSSDGSTLYVGGTFESVDGQARQNLAAIDLATGQATPYSPRVENGGGGLTKVAAIVTTPDAVYLGGRFSTVDGQRRAKAAATAADGTLLSGWRPILNNRVEALAVAGDGSIFIGGKFTTVTVGGTVFARQLVAQVTADTADVLSFSLSNDSQLTDNVVHTILATSTRVYLGVGAHGPNWVGSYNVGSGALVWKFGTVGNVQALSMPPDGSRLFFGGHFGTGRLQQTVCGTQHLHGLAFMADPETTGWHAPDCGWIPSIEPFGSNFQGVWTISNTPSFIWVGGGFKAVGGVSHLNLARFTL